MTNLNQTLELSKRLLEYMEPNEARLVIAFLIAVSEHIDRAPEGTTLQDIRLEIAAAAAAMSVALGEGEAKASQSGPLAH